MSLVSLTLVAALLACALFPITPAVGVVSPARFHLHDDGGFLAAPLATSHALDAENTRIERTVITIHGAARNSEPQHTEIRALAERRLFPRLRDIVIVGHSAGGQFVNRYAARLQGGNRLERGTVYFNYLRHFFGDALLERQSLRVVPGVGHDFTGIYASEVGVETLFGTRLPLPPPVAAPPAHR